MLSLHPGERGEMRKGVAKPRPQITKISRDGSFSGPSLHFAQFSVHSSPGIPLNAGDGLILHTILFFVK